MAEFSDGSGSGGYGGGTQGQYGPLASQTYYADPNAAGGLIQQLMQNIQQQQGNLNQFIANPTASPLFQGQLSGLLQALAPDEARGATNLQDIFRNAGNTSSSVFGDAAQNYQGGVQRNHQELASKLLGQSFQQIVSALLPQIQQGPQLLEAMRLSQSYRAPQQQSGGGRTSSPSGGGAQPNNSLQQLLSALGGSTQRGGTAPTQTQPSSDGGYAGLGGQGTSGGGYYAPINNFMAGGDAGGGNPVFIGVPEGGSIDSVDFNPQGGSTGYEPVPNNNNWVGSTSEQTGYEYAE